MIKTKKDLRETIQPYMRDEQHTAQRFYENFRERFKLTESLEEFMELVINNNNNRTFSVHANNGKILHDNCATTNISFKKLLIEFWSPK